MLEAFRARGSVAVRAVAGGEPLWVAAYEFVEALLLGVRSHLPDLRLDCELDLAPATGAGGQEASEIVALRVTFGTAPIIGEVATPSRFCHEVHLQRELRFALVRPPGCSASEPLVLHVNGLELPQLPEIPVLRRQIRSSLGSDFNYNNAYNWWLQNKDKEYPLERSKFNRIYSSLWGIRAMQLLPKQFQMDFFWGFLHGTNCHLEAFMFYHGRCDSRVRIAAQRGPGRDDEEKELLAFGTPLAKQSLAANRANGERFAKSVTNFAAMVYGRDIGQPPASAKVITKIFSAARSWGPGASGWQLHDPTWLCRDQTNSLGLVVKEQGRIIWRLPGGEQPARAPASGPPGGRPWACCRRRRPGGG